MVTGSQISLGSRVFAPPRTHVAFSPRRAPPPHATVGLVVGGVDMKVTPERDAAERVAKDAFLATLSNPYPNPDGEADDPPSTSYAIAAAEALLVRAATTRDAKQFPPWSLRGPCATWRITLQILTPKWCNARFENFSALDLIPTDVHVSVSPHPTSLHMNTS